MLGSTYTGLWGRTGSVVCFWRTRVTRIGLINNNCARYNVKEITAVKNSGLES